MERLTVKRIGIVEVKGFVNVSCDEICKNHICETCPIQKIFNKLAEYEDAEEQGLLIRLPLAKDDAFWEINRATTPASCYKRYAHSLQHCVYVLERLGKTVFLTKEEAEAALAEMEG